jgi:hypothetical protein
MNPITAFINWVFDPIQTNPTESRDDKYLAEAVDMSDLERRMRVLDQRRPIGAFGQNA